MPINSFGYREPGLGFYDEAYRRGIGSGGFRFNPDLEDPELRLIRARAENLGSMRRRNTIDEIGRAGLLGSSAGFGQLGQTDRESAFDYEQALGGGLTRQRAEQLGLYEGDLGYRRGLEMSRVGGVEGRTNARLNAMLQEEIANSQGLGQALGGLGSLVGLGIGGGFGGLARGGMGMMGGGGRGGGGYDPYQPYDPNNPWLGGY